MREIGPCISQSHIYPTGRASPVSQEAATNRTRVQLDVEVTNFGPIAKGRFKIKPLTVFVGPNNSGKTYAAMLAHSILSSYGNCANPWELKDWIRIWGKDTQFRSAATRIGKIAEKAGEGYVRIPPACIKDAHSETLRYFHSVLLGNIQLDFGAELEELVRIGCENAKIKIIHNGNIEVTMSKGENMMASSGFKETQFSIKNNLDGISISAINEDAQIKTTDYVQGRNERRTRDLTRMGRGWELGVRALSMLMMRMVQDIVGNLGDSYYLPAERSGILTTHKAIMSGIMKNGRHRRMISSKMDQLSGVISDFIEDLMYITERKQRLDRKNCQSMIEDMFGGQISIKESKVGLPSIIYRFKNTDIPLHRASSGISEIASFPIFFQNYVRRGDVVIIEEPEAHLHPTNQIKLANHIIRNVKKREANALLITHSAFVLEQLSLLVKMSRLTYDQRKEQGDEPEDYMEDVNIAPYLFKKSAGGDYTITEIKHSSEIGIAQDEFIKVTERAYNKDVRVEQALEKE